ncbi:helix-turn-helix domain-containing protein [Nocardia sp. NPDC058633]|uniref:helix-turn-helix domain-containing protein n=1 Tax=Nocardia sp. NPDC058633 TaxID=3346568 RepID=UPI0036515FAB
MFPIDTATAAAVRDVIAKTDRSEAAVARAVRLSPSTWHRRIHAKTSFTAAELARIVTTLGLTITELFDAIAEKRR